MAKRQYHGVPDKPLTPGEEGSHPIAILGKWRGHRYGFIARYRPDRPETRGEQFDSPFARLDHRTDIADGPRFDVIWLRRTGRWWRLRAALTLDEAPAGIAHNETLHPL